MYPAAPLAWPAERAYMLMPRQIESLLTPRVAEHLSERLVLAEDTLPIRVKNPVNHPGKPCLPVPTPLRALLTLIVQPEEACWGLLGLPAGWRRSLLFIRGEY